MKMYDKICVICDKKYTTKKINQKYCSYVCSRTSAYKSSAERGYIKGKGYRKATPKLKVCNFCGEKFTTTRGCQKYCSKECSSRNARKKQNLIKIGCIDFKGNIYYSRLRFEILKRDEFTCQYCGRNPTEDKIKLHVDHINPKKNGGLFVKDNLITACKDCNLGKSDVLLNERLKEKLKERLQDD